MTEGAEHHAAPADSPIGSHRVTVPDVNGDIRLDRYLARTFPVHSRSEWRRMIDSGLVLRDNLPLTPSLMLRGGEHLVLLRPASTPSELVPLDLPLEVVHEDDEIAVINKPMGLVVHPAKGHQNDTLLNALISRFPQLSGQTNQRPGIVHRLDRDTSGLMVIALTEHSTDSITGQLRNRQVVKQYLALVRGHPVEAEASIDAPIGRSPIDRRKMAVVSRGRAAITHYAVIRAIGNYSLLNVRLETGRTHQIRVHLLAINHPVAGDSHYGGTDGELGLRRQFLHASRLEFSHPATGDRVAFESDLPADLRDALQLAGA